MATNPYGKKPEQSTVAEKIDTPAAESSRRQMTLKRKIGFAILKPIMVVLVNFIWLTCRVKVVGRENMDEVVIKQRTVIPCYWHQQHLFCAWYMLQQIKHGMKVGFLVSPSVDGEIPAQIVSSRGATVIRGSSTRTGAQALRDMFMIITKDKVSPVTTSDGPTGPIYKFKPGAVMLSQMTKAPMLPIACAAKNAWYFKSWDKFMLPLPFTRVVVAVGEEVYVEKDSDAEVMQLKMEVAINSLMVLAKGNL